MDNRPSGHALDDLPDLPVGVDELFCPEKQEQHQRKKNARKNIDDMWVHEALAGVPKGQRNDMCARLAGYYLRIYPGEVEKVEQILERWNERNKPPLDWKEVQKTVASIAKRAGTNALSEAIDAIIEEVQILKYPDGCRKYNIKVRDHCGYAQMTLDQLSNFNKFRIRIGEVTDRIPEIYPSKKEWTTWVNALLAEAEPVDVSEDETPIGLISGAINSEVFSEGRATEMCFLGNRIIVCGPKGDEKIMLKIEIILSMIRYVEKLTRKQVGKILRDLGFRNRLVWHNNRPVRAWQIPFTEWENHMRRKGELIES